MKKILLIYILFLSTSIFSQEVKTNSKNTVTKKLTDAEKVMLGTWTGTMNNKNLTIVIVKINGNTIEGYNILGTTKRNLKGTFSDGGCAIPCCKSYSAILSEPGDNKWDGVFNIGFFGYGIEEETESEPKCQEGEFELSNADGNGSWKSNNGKSVTEITSLVKK